MSNTIHKYMVADGEGLVGEPFDMPMGAMFLSLGRDSADNNGAAYFAVDTDAPRLRVQFARLNTGQEVPGDGEIIPLTTVKNGTHIRHILLVTNPGDESNQVAQEAWPNEDQVSANEFEATFHITRYGNHLTVLDSDGDVAVKITEPGVYRLVVD